MKLQIFLTEKKAKDKWPLPSIYYTEDILPYPMLDFKCK